MTATLPYESESAILARIIAPDERGLTIPQAEEVLTWAFSPEDHAKMSELAAKVRAGTLTQAERAKIDEYGRIGSFIGIMKSKARRALKAAS